jgi:DNA-binding CsgD family transcriptional regulator
VPTHRSQSHVTSKCTEAIFALIPNLCEHPNQLHRILQTSLVQQNDPPLLLHFVPPHHIPQNVTVIAFQGYRYGWIEGKLPGQIANAYGEVIAHLERHLLYQYWQQTNYHPPFEPPRCREREVLTLSYNGLTYKEIAQTLQISPATVNSHAAKLRDKFGVRTTHAVVPIADQAGLFLYLRHT